MLSGLWGTACQLDIALTPGPGRKMAPLGRDKKGERAYVYSDGEDVSGTVTISVKRGKKLEHQGVKVEIVGRIDMLNDNSSSYEFFMIGKDVEPPGAFYDSKVIKWKFGAVDKTHETYYGINVRLRYFVRVTVLRGYSGNVSRELDIVVHNVTPYPDINNTIRMEVGIEDCLHIEFEYDKSKYHLKDVIVGKVYFLLVRIKIKHMEIDVIRTEAILGTGSQAATDSETITKFEVMDGTAVKGECIPVRLYLSGYDLTPTYKNTQNKFSVKYFINLVLVDEEDRRYFKKQEIFLWRKRIG